MLYYIFSFLFSCILSVYAALLLSLNSYYWLPLGALSLLPPLVSLFSPPPLHLFCVCMFVVSADAAPTSSKRDVTGPVLHLRFGTPAETIIAKPVYMVTLPAVTGVMGVLADHAPTIGNNTHTHKKHTHKENNNARRTSISGTSRRRVHKRIEHLLSSLQASNKHCRM